jgi:predicted dehydrogenase
MARVLDEAVIIGYGSMGRKHRANLEALGKTVFALGDPFATVGNNSQRLIGIKSYTDSIECLEEEAPNRLVVISSPTYLHAEHALKAMYCGASAVYIEKPLAVNKSDARHILEASLLLDVPVCVGYNFRAHSGFLEISKNALFPNGLFSAFGIDDHTTWPSYIEQGADSYLHDETGAMLWTSSSHAIDMAIALFGKVAHVVAGETCPEHIVLRLKHVNGGTSVLYNRWEKDHPKASILSYITTADSIVVDLLAPNSNSATMHKDLMNTYLKLIGSKDSTPIGQTNLVDAVHGVDVLVAAEQSLKLGSGVSINENN